MAELHRGLERREGQIQMAEAVEEVLTDGGRLLVEAGPGTGKTFAYLVPALLHARVPDRRIVVSTWTRNLQEQIIEKDLPMLRKALGTATRVCLVQGRENHVCRRRAEEAWQRGAPDSGPHVTKGLDALIDWARSTRSGLRSELQPAPKPALWSAVRAERGNCLAQRSPFFQSCVWQWSRRNARDAAILVVNHALLMADLKLRREGASVLPAYDGLIIDEAHHLEEVAADHLGVHVRRRSVFGQLGALDRDDPSGLVAQLARRARELAELLFDQVGELLGDRSSARLRGAEGFSTEFGSALMVLADALHERSLRADNDADSLEWSSRGEAVHRLGRECSQVIGCGDPDQVSWVEQGGDPPDLALRTAPVEPAAILQRELFEPLSRVVMTSATLCTPGLAEADGFEYLRRSSGIGAAATARRVDSPFDYLRQTQVIIDLLPDPRDAVLYETALAERIPGHVARTEGHAFVLFTGRKTLRFVADAIRESLESSGIRVLVQGSGDSRSELLRRFRREQPAVLFGLASFWEGVDVPGPELSQVILTRLPFAPPGHPRDDARSELLRESGQDPFQTLSLPQAVLRFKQGFGRLIRSVDDTGVVTVMDPRIVTRRYGKVFLDALPECPRVLLRNGEEEVLMGDQLG